MHEHTLTKLEKEVAYFQECTVGTCTCVVVLYYGKLDGN